MAKADYILCDRCDAKIVYDGEGKIAEGIFALGLNKMPALCEACRSAIAMAGANEQPLAHELRVMAGADAFNDSRADDLLMQTADIIDAVANYRAVVESWADGIEKRLRDCADNPAANGMAPVHPATLREAAHEIERRRDEVRIAVEEGAKRLSEIEELRFQYEHLDGLWRKLVEAAQEAGHVNGEGSDFAYLLMSLRMGPPDRYRTALDRIHAVIDAEAKRVTTDDAPDEMAPVESSAWVMGYKAALERVAKEFRA
ncbi:hypothetical protein TSA6c_00050 [Azospirillum sp. TSA6c]|uniref:hypothetical protein n=1 Tax=Azospirillum sp. TSA6c TaxID=709813 RepID=UPI000D617F35|nr:hypothetical protein [Azospirillum sp. TSA6c]PWC54673.1 hypothetical protein TSA6c_00050 [Azospirillum sp. TSA6c]